METLGELVGTVEGFERPALGSADSHATRRRVEHFERLLRRAEADGTLRTLFTPGYPPVRVQVAAGDSAAVVVVADTDAEVRLGGPDVVVETNGRVRRVSLPFDPSRSRQVTIDGRSVATVV